VANERLLRKRTATASPPLKSAAAKGTRELDVTRKKKVKKVRKIRGQTPEVGDQRLEVRKEPGALIIVPSILPISHDKALKLSCSAVEM
jgi:hypothetical protein